MDTSSSQSLYASDSEYEFEVLDFGDDEDGEMESSIIHALTVEQY